MAQSTKTTSNKSTDNANSKSTSSINANSSTNASSVNTTTTDKTSTSTKSKSENLRAAKAAKNDEFYTQLGDIENELKHYKAHFKDKIVLCNCDDPLESNFFKYFFLNFRHLGLKELITTCYKSQDFVHISKHDSPKSALYISIHKDDDFNVVGNPITVLSDIEQLLSLSLMRHSKAFKR